MTYQKTKRKGSSLERFPTLSKKKKRKQKKEELPEDVKQEILWFPPLMMVKLGVSLLNLII